MIPFIEPVLFTDPQAAKPAYFCRRCGGEIYHPAELCDRCGVRP